METKKDIRAQMIQERNALSSALREAYVVSITDRICVHPWWQEADVIYVYIDTAGEVGTRRLIRKAWEVGKRVAVPRVTGDEMAFYEIDSFVDVASGTMQIQEPLPHTIRCEREGLILMPGVAFDENGHRIGYGKGYYDRYLSNRPSTRTMALAFELQLLDAVPFAPFDVSATCIVTEQRFITPTNKRRT